MKNILVLMVTTLFILSGCGEPRVPSSQLVYSEIVHHNKTESDSFELTKMWLASAFNDSKSVIEYANKENGTIIGKGIFKNVHYGAMVDMDTRFTLKIEVKNNKSRLTFQDMVIYPNSSPAFNMWNMKLLQSFNIRAKELVDNYNSYMNKQNLKNQSDW